MKFYLKIYFFIVLSSLGLQLDSAYSNSCQMYTDPFGALQTGYTMGDLVRYTVTSGINIYNEIVTPPAGAQDIFNFGNNTYNLYNALGYLYAGWVALNYQPTISWSDWVGSYRQEGDDPFGANPQKALLEFDNNQYCQHIISFPMNSAAIEGWNILTGAGYHPKSGDTNSSFNNTFAYYYKTGLYTINVSEDDNKSGASCGWCSHPSVGNFIHVFGKSISYPPIHKVASGLGGFWSSRQIPGAYVYPTGQFFGARIAHVLGAVVNDVPWSTDTTSNALGGTGTFTTNTTGTVTTPLISGPNGQGTALPMIAVMQGNAAGWAVTDSGGTTTSTAPVGMFQPSTAHFGSMSQFLANLPKSPGTSYNYLANHLGQTVKRLATLCSYKISTDTNTLNLIEIVPTIPGNGAMTAYDNGVIFAIQNNTGERLQINQVASGISTPIGNLGIGNNNYFLHTASLMSATSPSQLSTASPSQNPTQMISIIDSSDSSNIIGTYIQLLSAAQLTALYTAVNTKLGTITLNGQTLPALSYNQIIPEYTVPTDTTPAYVVVTNFDPTFNSSNALNAFSSLPTDNTSQANILNSYRIQAVNVAEFAGKPYLMTMQINKENIGYGVQTNYAQNPPNSGNYVQNTTTGAYAISGYSLSSGAQNDYILYPSIVSAQLFTWQNHAQYLKSSPTVQYYSQIPLLILPETVWKSGIAGVQAYYLIWLMSYAAAMTEFSYNKAAFGDIPAVYNNVFSLLDRSNNPLSRMIIDQQGNLKSGQMLSLGESFGVSVSICGCDTFDSGGGFNQDIPILNIYTDAQGNPVVNKKGAEYINLMVNFGSLHGVHQPTSLTDFCNLYGLPYSNMALFSVPMQALKDGVAIEMQQPVAGNYQLIISSTKEYTDNNGNQITAGAVLAAPTIFIDPTLITGLDVYHDVQIAILGENFGMPITSVGLGKKKNWNMTYVDGTTPYLDITLTSMNNAKMIALNASLLNLSESSDFANKIEFADNTSIITHPIISNGKGVNSLGEKILTYLKSDRVIFLKVSYKYLFAQGTYTDVVTKIDVIDGDEKIKYTYSFKDKIVQRYVDFIGEDLMTSYNIEIQTRGGELQNIPIDMTKHAFIKLVQKNIPSNKPKLHGVAVQLKAKTPKAKVKPKAKAKNIKNPSAAKGSLKLAKTDTTPNGVVANTAVKAT